MTNPPTTIIDDLLKEYDEHFKEASLAIIDSLIAGITTSFLARLLFCIAPVFMLKQLRIKIENTGIPFLNYNGDQP